MKKHATAVRITAVWALLVFATVFSVDLGSHQTIPLFDSRGGVAVALAIGFGKAEIIGLEFMELRRAPRVLKWLFTAWIAAVGTTLITLYLLP
ncbi:cytochrome C oxidase subunit IV family protein [Nocardia asteroides]|uniref:cytochrome C oxidase subunit IV family protein n=1 Tax=Nocardia asteroides TaxID=1824 RepID=UPI0034327DC0